MKYIVFDIETQNTFDEVGSSNPADLDISVISVYNSETGIVKSFLQENFSEMWPLFRETEAMIGYNSNHFDIPLLNKYYKRETGSDLTKIKSIDIMQSIKESFGRRVKLDDIANATLGKNKIAHGLEAVKWWKQGKIDEIIKYCEEDVLITHQVFLYAKENKILKLKDYISGKIINIPINTENWKPDIKESEPLSLF
jgi:DEAD/DEAH box helicase domain-containing protein